jgi:5'-nucleotidase
MPPASPRIVISNDDGIAAEGLHALTRAIAADGLDAIVVAPDGNRSGVARLATYGTPVFVEPLGDAYGLPHLSCTGSPVDCVRAALLGDIAPQAELVVSGINHGPNLGDDHLNSGTVGAASEGALLDGQGLAVSQQQADDHFHILDSVDQTTPVFDLTARVGSLFAKVMLETPAPPRAMLNVNVPVVVADAEVEVSRSGRRYYGRGTLEPIERDGRRGFLSFGERGGPTPPYDAEAGTDFGALTRHRVAAVPLSFAWDIPVAERERELQEWARTVAAQVTPLLGRELEGV